MPPKSIWSHGRESVPLLSNTVGVGLVLYEQFCGHVIAELLCTRVTADSRLALLWYTDDAMTLFWNAIDAVVLAFAMNGVAATVPRTCSAQRLSC